MMKPIKQKIYSIAQSAVVLLFLFHLPVAAQPSSNTKDISQKQAAIELIHRVLPKDASSFIVKIIPADSGRDVFEIESRHNAIILSGNNAVSVASAFNWYLKCYCHCEIS